MCSSTPGCLWCDGGSGGVCRDGTSNGGSSTAADYKACYELGGKGVSATNICSSALFDSADAYVEESNSLFRDVK